MRKLFIGLMLVVCLPVAYFWIAYPSYSWKQKTHISVQTPSGLKSGSATVFVKWSDGPKILPDPPKRSYQYEGEATVVDLGEGKYLFALINGAELLGLKVFGNGLYTQFTDGLGPAIKHTAKSGEQEKPIPPEVMPLLVTFDDINDPASVKEVNPNNLAATFGTGYALKSITLEITDEPVIVGEVEKFGFMQKLKTQATLSGLEKFDPSKRSEIHYLTTKAFVRGEKK